MAQKRLIPVITIAGGLPNPTPAAKCKATLELPSGPRLRKLWLEGTVTRATTAPRLADVFDCTQTVKIKIGGKIVREFTIPELDAIHASYGTEHCATVTSATGSAPATPDTGNPYTFRVPIHFWENWRPGIGWREGMAWPTVFENGYRLPTIQVEVPLEAYTTGLTGGATSAHSFNAWLEVDDVLGKVDANGRPIFNITKWERFTQSYSAAGQLPLTNLDRRDIIQQISLFTGYNLPRDATTGSCAWQSNDAISKVRFSMNDVVYYDDITKSTNDEHNRKYGMYLAAPSATVYGSGGACGVPLADRFDLIFEDTDNPFDALPSFTAQSMVLTPTMASASASQKAFTILIARYGSGLPS